MIKTPPRIWRILAWTFLAFLLLLLPVYRVGRMPLVKSYTLGYAVSIINIAGSLVSIQWAFGRGIKTFYLVVIGGMMLRFLFIAVIVYLVLLVLQWPLAGFLLSFVIFYIFLQYHETRFINQELKGIQSHHHDQPNR